MTQTEDVGNSEVNTQQEVSTMSNNRETERTPLVVSSKTSNGDLSVSFFFQSGRELKKSLSFKHAFAYIVSILFGSGIFISPSLVAKQTSNMGMALVVWVISGVPSLFGALCFCELACMYKKTGSYYLFILEAYGEMIAFTTIWLEVIIVVPSACAILAVAIGEHIVEPFYSIDTTTGVWIVKSVAVVSICLGIAMNCISTSFVGKSQIFFSTTQILSVCFLVILGIWQVVAGHIENYVTMFNNSGDFNIGRFGLALYNGLWAYDGWGQASSISEELHDLEKDLWLSFITGIPFVIICYIFINLALMSALSRNEIAASPTVATAFVAKVLGQKASLVIPVAVALSCFGSMQGEIFMSARVFLSAARERQLPYMLSYIHKEKRVPIPALFTILILSIIWVLSTSKGTEILITYFSFAVWLKYGLAIFSVLVMRRRKPDLARPFKVWIANPVFTSLFALFLVTVPFIKRPVESSISLFLFLSALPIYFVFIKKNNILPSCLHHVMDNFGRLLQRRCNLVPCIFNESLNAIENGNEEL